MLLLLHLLKIKHEVSCSRKKVNLLDWARGGHCWRSSPLPHCCSQEARLSWRAHLGPAAGKLCASVQPTTNREPGPHGGEAAAGC